MQAEHKMYLSLSEGCRSLFQQSRDYYRACHISHTEHAKLGTFLTGGKTTYRGFHLQSEFHKTGPDFRIIFSTFDSQTWVEILMSSVPHKPEEKKPTGVKCITVLTFPPYIRDTQIKQSKGWDVLLVYPTQIQSQNTSKVFRSQIFGLYEGEQPHISGTFYQCVQERWAGYFSPAKHGNTKVISILSLAKHILIKSGKVQSEQIHLYWIDMLPEKNVAFFIEQRTRDGMRLISGKTIIDSTSSVNSFTFVGLRKMYVYSLMFPLIYRDFQRDSLLQKFIDNWNCSFEKYAIDLPQLKNYGTWTQAYKLCKNHNGTLPIINSEEEQREIIDLLKFIFIDNAPKVYPVENILFIGMISGKVSATFSV